MWDEGEKEDPQLLAFKPGSVHIFRGRMVHAGSSRPGFVGADSFDPPPSPTGTAVWDTTGLVLHRYGVLGRDEVAAKKYMGRVLSVGGGQTYLADPVWSLGATQPHAATLHHLKSCRTCLGKYLQYLSGPINKSAAHVQLLMNHQGVCKLCKEVTTPNTDAMATSMAAMATSIDAMASSYQSSTNKAATKAEQAKKAKAEEANKKMCKMDNMCKAVGSLMDGVEQLHQSVSAAVALGVEQLQLQRVLLAPSPAYPLLVPAQPAPLPATSQPAPPLPATSQPAPTSQPAQAVLMDMIAQLLAKDKK